LTGDHERPLAARGKSAAPRIGAEMKRRDLLPDLVLCSTATRARATLDLVLKAMGITQKTKFDRRIYEAGPEDFLSLVGEFCPSADRLLIVGHNPSIQVAASRLARAGDEDAAVRLETKYPTGGLAVIDFDRDNWQGATLNGGYLAAFITPAML